MGAPGKASASQRRSVRAWHGTHSCVALSVTAPCSALTPRGTKGLHDHSAGCTHGGYMHLFTWAPGGNLHVNPQKRGTAFQNGVQKDCGYSK